MMLAYESLRPRRFWCRVVADVYRREKTNGKEIIRILSAREADKRERKIYRQKRH